MDETKVIFKKFKGEVLALFPQQAGDCNPYRTCGSYQHVGQHSAADVRLSSLPAASPREADPLRLELERMGYRLQIGYRMTRKDLQCRIVASNLPPVPATPAKEWPPAGLQEGRLAMTTTDLEKPITEYIPVRTMIPFSTCVPMRPFRDWLKVTGKGQAELEFDPFIQVLKVKVGNARAEFKCIDAMEFPTGVIENADHASN